MTNLEAMSSVLLRLILNLNYLFKKNYSMHKDILKSEKVEEVVAVNELTQKKKVRNI